MAAMMMYPICPNDLESAVITNRLSLLRLTLGILQVGSLSFYKSSGIILLQRPHSEEATSLFKHAARAQRTTNVKRDYLSWIPLKLQSTGSAWTLMLSVASLHGSNK